jgi:hypothetical protein
VKHPSASNAEAFVKCGASHVLAQSDKHNDYMYRGTEGHEPLAALVNGRVPNASDRGMDMISRFPWAKVLGGVTDLEAEVAYAVNVKTRTVRRIGREIGREYGKLERYEIPTTLDVQGEKDTRAFLRDWKFGVSSSWWQLLVQCMAVAYDVAGNPAFLEVDAGFVFIDGETQGEEYRQDTRVVPLEEIDQAADDMVAAWDRVEKMVADLARGEPIKTTEGEWCRYCGAYPHCPSKWKLARAMIGHTVESGSVVAAMTAEEQGVLWTILQEKKKQIDAALDTIKGSVAAGPIPLPNGKQLVTLRMKGASRLDKSAVMGLLDELGASDDDRASVYRRSSDYTQVKEVKR